MNRVEAGSGSMGSICELQRDPTDDLPAYVYLPNALGWGFNLRRPGPYGGYLGSQYNALTPEIVPVIDPQPGEGKKPMWLGTPRLADLEVIPDVGAARFNERQSLLGRLDGSAARVEPQSVASEYVRVRERALSLMTAQRLKRAFDIEGADPRLLDRYGRNVVGHAALIGRRLVEAGVRFVNVTWDGYFSRVSTAFDSYWDTHAQNFVALKQCNLPNLDQTFTALLEELDSTGQLDETLVVMMSDFGRTPRVNGAAGRDHWTDCYTVLFAGAGIRGGTVYGASDGHAAYIKDAPVRPRDICATIYQILGIDPESLIHDRVGRPVAVAHGGKPIEAVMRG